MRIERLNLAFLAEKTRHVLLKLHTYISMDIHTYVYLHYTSYVWVTSSIWSHLTAGITTSKPSMEYRPVYVGGRTG